MFQRGLVLSLLGIVLLSFVGYPIADGMLPWPPPAFYSQPIVPLDSYSIFIINRL